MAGQQASNQSVGRLQGQVPMQPDGSADGRPSVMLTSGEAPRCIPVVQLEVQPRDAIGGKARWHSM
eukprot:10974288-Alexandrium_andersonii.AAC.1